MRNIFVVALAILVFCGIAEAQQNTQQQEAESEKILVDVKDLPPEVVARIRARQAIETLGEYRQYAEMGRAVGIAVDGALTAITKHTAEFATTGVGKFTMFLVAWKVMGNDFVHYTFGLLFFFVWTGIFIWSYWRNCITRHVLVKKDGHNREYKVINDPTHDDKVHQSRLVHAGVYGAGLAVSLIVMFARA